ncbi:MAG: MFS transporter [Acidimicrobiia bacterium]|nr:MFS transporter [Acidimicrobiia bacterium]
MREGDAVDQAVHDRRWVILAVLCVTLFVTVMDNTVLNVALPRLVSELGASTSQLQWIVDSYTLVFAGLLLTAGSLGDRFGRKRFFIVGMVVFGLGSVLSALAANPTQLIVTRGLMGVGGALLTPATLSIIADVFREPRERAKAIAIWSAFAGLGSGIGPVVGGLLLSKFSWASVFWINVPIVAGGAIAAIALLPDSRNPAAARFDPLGAVLSIVASVVLLYAIIQAPETGWTSPTIIAGFVAAAALIVAFVWWETRTSAPMLDMALFRDPRFGASNLALTIAFFCMFGMFFLLSQYLQFVKGYTPLGAGLRMAPFSLIMVVVTPRSARLAERFGTNRIVAAGLLFAAAHLILVGTWRPSTSYAEMLVAMVLGATGMSIVSAPATAAVMAAVPREKAGAGSAMNNTTRQLGGALGVALIGSLAASGYASRIGDALDAIPAEARGAARHSLGAALRAAAEQGGAGAEFADAARLAFSQALLRAGGVAAIVAVAGAYLALRYIPARAAGTAVPTPARPAVDPLAADPVRPSIAD